MRTAAGRGLAPRGSDSDSHCLTGDENLCIIHKKMADHGILRD